MHIDVPDPCHKLLVEQAIGAKYATAFVATDEAAQKQVSMRTRARIWICIPRKRACMRTCHPHTHACLTHVLVNKVVAECLYAYVHMPISMYR